MALLGSRTVAQVHASLQVTDVWLTKEYLDKIEKIIPKEKALSSYMPPVNLDKNGLFKK